jgi:tight adherence protein B
VTAVLAAGAAAAFAFAALTPAAGRGRRRPAPGPGPGDRPSAGARRGRRAATELGVVDLTVALAAALRSGCAAADALRAAAPAAGPLRAEVLAAAEEARLGGPPVDALARLAIRPGAAGLAAVCAAWRSVEPLGAAASGVLAGVAAALEDAGEARQELDAQLAGIRAATRLLAALPLGGLLLAGAAGASAWSVLAGTGSGHLLLLAAGGLDLLGWRWSRRLIRGAAGHR